MHDRTARNIGLVLTLAGFALSPWPLGSVFLPGGHVETFPSVIFILIADLFFIAGGVWFLARSRILTRKTAWFSLVIFLIIPAGVEGGLHLLRFFQYGPLSQGLDRRLSFSCFRDKPWAPDLFREQHALVVSFEQYLGWRTREFRGTYINIEADGTRHTINPVPGDQASGMNVFLFGGSTMWGAYVRDSCTIPSLLSLKCGRDGPHIYASNFGEQGYNFTQGVIHLTLLLRAGKRPDLCIFYEGFNDIDAAESYGRAGETSLSSEINELVEARRAGVLRQVGFAAGEFITRECMIYRSVERLTQVLRGSAGRPEGIPEFGEAALDSLSRGIAGEYRMSYALLDSLSRMYNFKYACVLQPSLYTKAPVTREEESVDPRAHDPQLRSLFLMTYSRLREEHFPHMYDFTHIFDTHTETVYIDVCHVSEEGNTLLADGLIPILRP
jgi:hypothetical protein